MKSINKYLIWLDHHLLELLAGFLLAFLPLYPKWPLFDALPGYIVRVRLEDFVIGSCLLIFLIQVSRGRAYLKKNPLFKPIILYLAIGLISAISAVLITHTVPAESLHVGKLFLHWARRVEYMSLAFIFFAALSSRDSLKRILTVFVITGLIVSLYGFGQKYLAWPVYSTMNREFSKGWRLVLTEHARVSSTFAGHYDLAAFAVIQLPLLASLIFFLPKKHRLWALPVFILMFATLLLTASRTSFIAYLVGLTVVFALLGKKVSYKKAILAWIFFMVISAAGLRSFGSLYSRFAHVLMLDRIETFVNDQVFARLKPSPSHDIHINQDLSLVYTETDTPPSTPPPLAGTLPPDVYEAIPESFPEASLSGVPDSSGTGQEGKPRTYSDSAFKYGLSSAIRFDALWPRALAGFKSNPLLGSGYSTLTKEQVTDFTEAESTDNDYLRALGETGLLGFISYFAIFIIALIKTYQHLSKSKSQLEIAYYAGFIALVVSLLVNALYIDIFEASKVAYTLWAVMGLTFGLMALGNKKAKNQ